MAHLKIYRPSKSVMQSGRAKTKMWVAEFEPSEKKIPDSLMGWNGSGDTRSQIVMHFSTLEEALSFAKRQGHSYTVRPDQSQKLPKPKSYADNFKYNKVQ